MIRDKEQTGEAPKYSVIQFKPQVRSNPSFAEIKRQTTVLTNLTNLRAKLKDIVSVKLPCNFNSLDHVASFKLLKKFRYSQNHFESMQSFGSDSEDFHNVLLFNRDFTHLTLLQINNVATKDKDSLI